MKNKRNIVLVITLVLFAGFFLRAVLQKEKIIQEGALVLLPLAPVDPRSLMQGDYMQLNYAINNELRETNLNRDEIRKRGYVILTLDEQHRGAFKAIYSDLPQLEGENEIAVKYFNWDGFDLAVGAESYFFQEGKDTLYEQAKFGGLKVDAKGNSVLIGLYKENLERIE
ncbi:GDYXXLXY domain-containing protein [Myroides sp. 1354]|uniref:GDYXXLXY domain-containing protein n=1 Tax=unclassified Myroides TaxID=2642485 RepID=UPI002576BDF2|nr:MULTISPECIES: GDYXXLXY domain-containing protein [unclassified Myroides]MDM1044580.1 GDYXXLXY domain-containing protein [Myroides sp. R163-1]MDM1055293.1 GDYXXLXY domain-containing protein [Myroides sp. 1354]MDM1068590.1 GDYXXLXY domain-containing protein [Myroides sp. 1372]